MAKSAAELHEEFMQSELACLLFVDEIVDGQGVLLEVDRSVSVSALPETETGLEHVSETLRRLHRRSFYLEVLDVRSEEV